ncbi:SCP2 sterol-binding domain-containing protein, partial [Actinomadura kijaniata]|uniref:SCP2 sterol-binding domain-containing protein n=1 Tax=Actinomadura kijaniata TaxID=46161 RepID=UPI00082F74BF
GRRRVQQGFHRLVHGASDERIERRFGTRAQRVFFAGMARAFDPAMAGGFEGELMFRLTRRDGTATEWTIRVADGRARSRPGPAREPALTVTAATADFLRVLAGDANPATLLMDGRLKLRGDVELAPRLSEMFGGPSPY